MKTKTISQASALNKEQEALNHECSITYGIVKEIYYLNGKRSRKAYGIVGYSSAEADKTANIVLSVNDITSKRKHLTKLVEKLNKNKVSPIHIADITEDFLS